RLVRARSERRGRRVAASFPVRARRGWFGRTDMSGEVDERGMLEKALRRELHAERRARLGHDACSMERAAADLEEVVFRRDVLHAEDLLPDVGNLTFQSFRHARHLPMELYFGLDLAGRPD